MMKITTKIVDCKTAGDVCFRSKEGWFVAHNQRIAEKLMDSWVYGFKADIEWVYRDHQRVVTSITLHDEKLLDNNRAGGTMTPQWTGD